MKEKMEYLSEIFILLKRKWNNTRKVTQYTMEYVLLYPLWNLQDKKLIKLILPAHIILKIKNIISN